MNDQDLTQALAQAAAACIVDEGMDYAQARQRAARQLEKREGRAALRSHLWPDNATLEAAVREHIAIFHADTQPGELLALRQLAERWMTRLAEFHPMVGGAVWRGTATALSAVQLDLYCEDPKSAEITLLNWGVDFEVASDQGGRGPAHDVLVIFAPCPPLPHPVPLHLHLRDLDEQRGARLPDAQGLTWHGDLHALRQCLNNAVEGAGP